MQKILSLIKEGESQTTEFKLSFQKEVIVSVVAFANAKGGKIFIGVSDNGEIVGVTLKKETLQDWINQIKMNTSPSVIPDIYEEYIEDKIVVIIDVKEYPIKPISYKNRYLLRRKNSNHVMSMEEIANEYLKTKNSSWDYYINNDNDFRDISLEKVEKFMSMIENNLGKKFLDSPMLVLQKYGLVKDDKITFGAYLLFTNSFCPISGIQAGRFKTSTDIIDSISLNTDLFTEVDELMVFLRKHFMVEYIITGNPQREERYDYPLDAIREIVLNMIVHRDYRDSSDSVIKIFDDRIEFFNPGELYDNLTVEQLLSNNYESKTRNKLIALMFKECGFIEKYGSGISRIKQLCKEYGLANPIFKEMQKGFKVIVYKKTTQETTQETKKRLSTKEKILIALKKESSLTREDLANQIGVSSNAIKQHLSKLKEENKIKRVGSTKSGYWEVLL